MHYKKQKKKNNIKHLLTEISKKNNKSVNIIRKHHMNEILCHYKYNTRTMH